MYSVIYVSVIILFVMEWLQIKFCVFEYSVEATVYKLKLFKNIFTYIGKTNITLSPPQKKYGYLNYYWH